MINEQEEMLLVQYVDATSVLIRSIASDVMNNNNLITLSTIDAARKVADAGNKLGILVDKDPSTNIN
jgi:hypothetical protein